MSWQLRHQRPSEEHYPTAGTVAVTVHPPTNPDRQWARHLGRAGFAIVGCTTADITSCVRVGETLLFGTSSGPDNSRTGHSRAARRQKVALKSVCRHRARVRIRIRGRDRIRIGDGVRVRGRGRGRVNPGG